MVQIQNEYAILQDTFFDNQILPIADPSAIGAHPLNGENETYGEHLWAEM